MNVHDTLNNIHAGNFKTLAKAISFVENNDAFELLQSLPSSEKKIIGITGPPGAGKSTLLSAITETYVSQGKKIGIICIDPSSPFNRGAVLGDRIRMQALYGNTNVFIRSLASRGNAGGLHPKVIEITDVMKFAPFDLIIIETVGAGQTETEIAALADVTVVVLVPEAGDEIQTMKAGLMEIADIFVINKSDRPGAFELEKNIKLMLAPSFNKAHEVAVLKTVASQKKGIDELIEKIANVQSSSSQQKKIDLLTEKAYLLIQQKRMKDINKNELKKTIHQNLQNEDFNIYRFAKDF